MYLSKEGKLICGLLLIAVPTIVYGGFTLLGILTNGSAGLAPGNLDLSEQQYSLWRAGHAHAGVLVILSLILQPLIDQIAFSNRVKWVARLGAPCASILLPAGFFGLAFFPFFQWSINAGMVLLGVSVLITGMGLLWRDSKEIEAT